MKSTWLAQSYVHTKARPFTFNRVGDHWGWGWGGRTLFSRFELFASRNGMAIMGLIVDVLQNDAEDCRRLQKIGEDKMPWETKSMTTSSRAPTFFPLFWVFSSRKYNGCLLDKYWSRVYYSIKIGTIDFTITYQCFIAQTSNGKGTKRSPQTFV